MKTRNDEFLSELLSRWDEPATASDTFRASVWSRIASRQKVREASSWNRAMDTLAKLFANPAYATAAAVIAIALSIGAAHRHAESVAQNRRDLAQLHYLASISPLAQIDGDGELRVK